MPAASRRAAHGLSPLANRTTSRRCLHHATAGGAFDLYDDTWYSCDVQLGSHSLLESILWTPTEGFWLLELHLGRLLDSAECFGVQLEVEEVRGRLESLHAELEQPVKVRLLVDAAGGLMVEAVALAVGTGAVREPVAVGVARDAVSSQNPWLRYKTSNRAVYESAVRYRSDCDDVLLHNERGELTEASSSNVVIEVAGRRWTPPLAAGLLPGTFRQHLLDTGEISERAILLEELPAVDRLYLINSVRKWRRARLSGGVAGGRGARTRSS